MAAYASPADDGAAGRLTAKASARARKSLTAEQQRLSGFGSYVTASSDGVGIFVIKPATTHCIMRQREAPMLLQPAQPGKVFAALLSAGNVTGVLVTQMHSERRTV